MSKQYEVEKFARGNDGKFFGMGARRFSNLADAREYFDEFRAEQSAVLGNGIRIDLRVRAGRKTIASVGGTLGDATVVREYA